MEIEPPERAIQLLTARDYRETWSGPACWAGGLHSAIFTVVLALFYPVVFALCSISIKELDFTMKLPTFLIIGVSRSGTTSLYRYLSAHPDVFMAPGKELRFFSQHFDKGLHWYAQHFTEAGQEKHRGEATPNYFLMAEVPSRVAATLPSAQLIVSLRHPVDRLYSTYWMLRERGKIDRSFDEIIAEELSAGHGPYLDQSKYADHFDHWWRYYRPEQFHVLFFEHLLRDPTKVFRSICVFLEIDITVPSIVGEVVNEYRQIRSLSIRRLSKRLPRKLQNAVGRLNTRPAEYPPLRKKTRQRLLDFFSEHNARLNTILDVPLPPSWSE